MLRCAGLAVDSEIEELIFLWYTGLAAKSEFEELVSVWCAGATAVSTISRLRAESFLQDVLTCSRATNVRAWGVLHFHSWKWYVWAGRRLLWFHFDPKNLTTYLFQMSFCEENATLWRSCIEVVLWNHVPWVR